MSPKLAPAVAQARLLVRSALRDLDPGALVLVAVSGGADSLALAVSTAFEASRAQLRWGAVVIDHRLQRDSAAVATTALTQAQQLGADPAEVVVVDVGTDGGPEAAARHVRHNALRVAAQRSSAAALLMGHTLDDQAENVLLGLTRGSGTRSLSGMAERDDLLRRPFLSLRRTQTEAVCRAAGLSWFDDPHNADPAFTRSRIRTRLLPVLEHELGPGVALGLARTAALARADADLLDTLATGLRARAEVSVGVWRVDALNAAPLALRSRVLRAASLAAGCPAGDVTAAHVIAVSALLDDWHGQEGIDLPGRVRVVRAADQLRFEPLGVTV